MAEETLAQRLGYPADARLLIMNCDDLGSSHSANIAMLDSMENGIASSATLMVPCSWAKEAVTLCGGKDIGVHLTLTAEFPTYRWRSLTGAASLHDEDGYFPRTTKEVWAKADLEDVDRELRAQIDQALAWGVDVTHIDSHMGTMYRDQRFLDIYLQLAIDYKLPVRMRSPKRESDLPFPARPVAKARGLVFPDDFDFAFPNSTFDMIYKYIPDMEPGVTEMLVHPVGDTDELRAYDFEAARVRVDEYAAAMSPAVAALLASRGVQLISYRPLRDLYRSTLPPSST